MHSFQQPSSALCFNVTFFLTSFVPPVFFYILHTLVFQSCSEQAEQNEKECLRCRGLDENMNCDNKTEGRFCFSYLTPLCWHALHFCSYFHFFRCAWHGNILSKRHRTRHVPATFEALTPSKKLQIENWRRLSKRIRYVVPSNNQLCNWAPNTRSTSCRGKWMNEHIQI